MNDKDWRHLKISIKKVKYFIEVKMTSNILQLFCNSNMGKIHKIAYKKNHLLLSQKRYSFWHHVY